MILISGSATFMAFYTCMSDDQCVELLDCWVSTSARTFLGIAEPVPYMVFVHFGNHVLGYIAHQNAMTNADSRWVYGHFYIFGSCKQDLLIFGIQPFGAHHVSDCPTRNHRRRTKPVDPKHSIQIVNVF